MYYSTYLRAAPQVRVLCLNTNLYAVKVRKAARALVQLDEENSSGLNASAAGVPIMRSALEDYAETADPGFDLWSYNAGANSEARCAGFFSGQLGTSIYLKVRKELLAAPLHCYYEGPPTDKSAEGPRCNPRQPNLPTALLSSPSVSPKDGNNPALRVLIFDRFQDEREQTWAYALGDYAQYRLPLYGFVGRSGFDGSVSLQIADAIRRSPFAYAAYQNHRYAGGRDVASGAISCSSLATTEEEFLRCIDEMP
ncbi:hypothetical protein, conserved [Eimeria necatrix]|uniref:Uncharacterized protein n=1 Tax=Eimeria necatrix TaxID=51315 RepID=U6MHZ2_9EIME|nr:hypothetical protein, conserved [Eimeria necatrix]CDJ63882.1 hypothetical protein, conserved [Eimeria necatrix]